MCCNRVKTRVLVRRFEAEGVACDESSCIEEGRGPRATCRTDGLSNPMPSLCEARRSTNTFTPDSVRLLRKRLFVGDGLATSVRRDGVSADLILLVLSTAAL